MSKSLEQILAEWEKNRKKTITNMVLGAITKIINNFTYHPPKEGQAERHTILRDKAMDLALLLIEECPESRELSLALTKLEEAVFWGNASIARNE